MALIDRLKYDGPGGQAPWLVHKHPSENLVLGTQLIVNKSQEAIFFKGGNALDVFGPGTHTLAAGNIPLLQKLVNLPFGGKTPFTAEVYFINKAAKLDLKWGTPDAFQVTEPRYQIIVNVRAYGQFGVKISDCRNFTTQIVGALHGDDVFAYDTVASYFKGAVTTKVKAAIAEMIVREKMSLLDITAHLDTASTLCREKVAGEFDRFGLEVLNFYIESINVPEADLARLKKILEDRAEFDVLGHDRYTRKRSFDVLETGASNEGAGGAAMTAGLGLGMGFGAASAAGDLARQIRVTPAEATSACPKCNAANSAGAKFCQTCGESMQAPKIACPACKAENMAGAKFCHECGAALGARKCPKCAHENPPAAKFCGECGQPFQN